MLTPYWGFLGSFGTGSFETSVSPAARAQEELGMHVGEGLLRANVGVEQGEETRLNRLRDAIMANLAVRAL